MTNKTGPIGPYKLMIKHILFVDIFTSYLQVNRLCMSTKSQSHTIHTILYIHIYCLHLIFVLYWTLARDTPGHTAVITSQIDQPG